MAKEYIVMCGDEFLGGNRFVAEYPDATIFESVRQAVAVVKAARICRGALCRVVKDYGLNSEATVATVVNLPDQLHKHSQGG